MSLEKMLNDETKGECRKQVRDFMLNLYELGYFGKGVRELEKERKKRIQRYAGGSPFSSQSTSTHHFGTSGSSTGSIGGFSTS